MIISCIGDSLTEGDYGVKGKKGIANIHKENYPYFLEKMTGAEVRNFGKCGFTPSSYRKYYDNGNVNVKNSDVIIIMLGTNGGLDPETDTPGNRDYRYIVERCMAEAPKSKIVLCTPPHVTKNPKYSNCGYAEQVKNAVEFVRNYAVETGLKIIDVAECADFNAENEAVMQPNDGLHFGKEGYKRLAKYIIGNLW